MDLQLPHAAKKGRVELMVKKHTVYISGPMTGLPECNYPAFHEAAERVRRAGHKAINPAVTGILDTAHLEAPTWHDFMISSINRMRQATAILQLSGHEQSAGARMEAIAAEYMGLERIEL